MNAVLGLQSWLCFAVAGCRFGRRRPITLLEVAIHLSWMGPDTKHYHLFVFKKIILLRFGSTIDLSFPR